VQGKVAPPADIANLTVVSTAGLAQVKWAAVSDLDVIVGGYVVVRFTSKTGTVTWADGIEVERVAGNLNSALVPLASGTYMVKALDSSGNWSVTEAQFAATEALLTGFTTLSTKTEHTAFSGTKTNMVVDSNTLKLSSAGLIDDYSSNIDSLTTLIDGYGGIASSGSYIFYQGGTKMDFTTAKNVRAFFDIQMTAFEISTTIDDQSALIDTWGLIDGAIVDNVDVILYIRTTTGDPNGSPTWSAWMPAYNADFYARGLDFKLEASNPNPNHNIQITSLSVVAKEPA
jgi:hypothetical protein